MTREAIARRRRYRATKGTKTRKGGGWGFSKMNFGPKTTPEWLQQNRDRAQKKRWADHMAFLRRQPGYKAGGKGIAYRPDPLGGGLRRKRRLKMDRASVKRRAAYKRRKRARRKRGSGFMSQARSEGASREQIQEAQRDAWMNYKKTGK